MNEDMNRQQDEGVKEISPENAPETEVLKEEASFEISPPAEELSEEASTDSTANIEASEREAADREEVPYSDRSPSYAQPQEPYYQPAPPQPQQPCYQPAPPQPQQPYYQPAPPQPQQPYYQPAPPQPQQPYYQPAPPQPQQPCYQPAPPQAQQPYYQPAYPQPQQPYEQYPPKKRKMARGTKVFLILLCVLSAVSLAVGGGLLVSNVVRSVVEQNLPTQLNPENFDEYNFNEYIENLPDSPFSPSPDDESDNVYESDEELIQPDVDTSSDFNEIVIEDLPDDTLSAKEVYQEVSQSTVTVEVYLDNDREISAGYGSGTVVTSDGYILTNSHVVLDRRNVLVTVTTHDGNTYDAVVVGADRTTDLAVLKADDHDFTPARFGDIDQMSIGDEVFAIGNPGGVKFSGSMTRGIISNVNRQMGKYSESGVPYIQTDAAINPGNSGGPLVNAYGQVIGINTSKIISTNYDSMGFAIPIKNTKDIIDSLISNGYVPGRVRLGITGQDVSAYGVEGFLIHSIDEDSSFNGTDIQTGDIITAINGEDVTGITDIGNILLKFSAGDTITVTVQRPSQMGYSIEKEFDTEIVLLEDTGETQG